MRRATLKDLGIGWFYWLIPAVFGFAGIVSFLAIKSEPESRGILIGCGVLFCTISLLAFLWPVLRLREKQEARFASFRSGRDQFQGILLPFSEVRFHIALIGGTVFGIAGLLLAIYADTWEYRMKGGLVCAGYTVFVILALRGPLAYKQGILLAKEGLVWSEALLAPCFIPWDLLLEAKLYRHQEKYTTTPSLGLALRNTSGVVTSARARRKIEENYKRFGWHLYCHAEALLVPLEVAETAVKFYSIQTNARDEFSTGAALTRISTFAQLEPGKLAV